MNNAGHLREQSGLAGEMMMKRVVHRLEGSDGCSWLCAAAVAATIFLLSRGEASVVPLNIILLAL
ncbi:hypothetical protein ACG873_31350 [Mesorhizobium sp. AaZ16]|uniref:hypothetical protein n=1 Tax=Mesorhizobium sp. AaZ16 TaxID=3402289 RepID=UPI00374F70D8